MSYDAAAQKGLNFLVQKGAATIGGFRTRSISVKSDTVDVTTADDVSRYRQLLAATGIKSASFTGAGVIKDTAAQQAMWTDILAQTADTYTFTIDGVGTISGLFQLTQLDASGEAFGEATYNATWESAGDLTLTLEA